MATQGDDQRTDLVIRTKQLARARDGRERVGEAVNYEVGEEESKRDSLSEAPIAGGLASLRIGNHLGPRHLWHVLSLADCVGH